MLRNTAPKLDRLPLDSGRTRLNWEDIHLFMEVARAGSFRKAAENSGLAANTLMRRIGVLEQRLGYILLARGAGGIEVTAEGREVLKVADRLQQEAVSLERMARGTSRGLSGSLKVSVTEGLGTFWLIPRLVDFRQKHPDLTIDLHCDMQPADLRSHQSDLSVQLERPAASDLVVTRLGYPHVVLFASDEYLRLYGTPSDVKDLVDYHFVEQVAPQVPSGMVKQVVPNPSRQALLFSARKHQHCSRIRDIQRRRDRPAAHLCARHHAPGQTDQRGFQAQKRYLARLSSKGAER